MTENTDPVDAGNLDLTPESFHQLMESAHGLIKEFYVNIGAQKGFHAYPQREVESWFDEPLPMEGMEHGTLLQSVREQVFLPATGNAGPNMYGYVMAGGNQVSSVADLLAATVNQNATKWHLGPSMTEIEKRVVKWAAEMIGFTPSAGGVMVSGGSGANLAGLTVARNIHFRHADLRSNGLFGMKPFTVYCSTETHNCIDKSVAELGIGTRHLRRVPAGPDFRADLNAIETEINADIANGFTPFCLVGNAGTVNTGAVDDLEGLAALAKKYDMWFHVDGAYGGLAASLEHLRDHYRGMELADSIALDFHKWLYQPYEIGCVLVRDWSILREAYLKKAEYLDNSLQQMEGKLEFNEHFFQLSRNAKAFKVWMSVKAYGFRRIRAMIAKDIALAGYLADQVEQSADFELCSRDILGITCFRYTYGLNGEAEVAAFNQRLIPALEADGRVFITGTKLQGKFVLRACVNNHRKERASIDHLLGTIRSVALAMKNQQA